MALYCQEAGHLSQQLDMIDVKQIVKSVPLIGPPLVNAKRALFGPADCGPFPGVSDYWERRYREGGTSGSYGRLALFKAGDSEQTDKRIRCDFSDRAWLWGCPKERGGRDVYRRQRPWNELADHREVGCFAAPFFGRDAGQIRRNSPSIVSVDAPKHCRRRCPRGKMT